MSKPSKRQRRNKLFSATGIRRGVEVLEFAFVLPMIMMLGLGAVEFSRALAVQQVLTNAAREGARHAVLAGSSSDSVRSKVEDNLNEADIDPAVATTTITPTSLSGTKSGTKITVRVAVSYSDVSWVPLPRYLSNTVLAAQCSMRHE